MPPRRAPSSSARVRKRLTAGARFFLIEVVESDHKNWARIRDRAGREGFIDGATNMLVSTLGVGQFPTGVTVVPGTNHVYTSNQHDNAVSVVDGTAFRLLGSFGVGLFPTDTEANVRTGHVFVSNQDDATVTVIQDG